MYSQVTEHLISIDLPRMTEDFRRSCGAIFQLGWKAHIHVHFRKYWTLVGSNKNLNITSAYDLHEESSVGDNPFSTYAKFSENTKKAAFTFNQDKNNSKEEHWQNLLRWF